MAKTTAVVDDTVTYEDVATAAFRIQDGIAQTYARYSAAFSEETGCKVHLKMDHKQFTGSFKERGALNALMLLPQDVHRSGVICASAGNHALAVSYHAKRLGIPVSVVMPTTAPLAKVGRCRKLGADVHLHGQTIADAKVYAEQLLQKTGQVYINGYNDKAIIAGAGTLGIEMIHDVKDVDAVIVPIGGGGLIAGIAVAIKKLRPEVLVIGAEPVACASFTRALEAGQPVTVQAKPTLADGLAVPTVGERAFRVARDLVDKVVLVQERHIALAVLRMLEQEKAIVEGAGAIGLAALLDPTLLPELKGKTVVLPTCGGNIDVNVLHRVIDRGLAADGRLIKVDCTISDRPGGLAAFCRVVAETGASIRDINHDRAFTDRDVSTAVAHCVLETTGPEHSALVRRKLEEAGHLPPSFTGASKL